MAKVTAPLLSFGGLGTIGKVAVYSKWKGRPYVRQYVIPGNPKTAGQTLTGIPSDGRIASGKLAARCCARHGIALPPARS